MRVLRIPFSTNVERVALAAAHKELAVEWVEVDPLDRSAVRQLSGQELVPVLVEDDGQVTADSTRILRRLEQLQPEPPLWPRAARNRAELEVSLTRTAVQATLHCLTGCALGEILGLVLATALGLSNGPSIVLATVLAFCFGYALSIRPLLGGGVPFRQALRLALAADTLSLLTMELVDNGIVIAVPGAMEAGLADALFWGSLALGLALAFVVAVPVNRWLIARGRGHAVVHALHGH